MAHTCGASRLLQRVPGMPGWPCCLLPGFSPFPSPWQSWLGSTAPRLGHPTVRAWPGAADGACLLFLSRKRPSPSGDAAAPERLEALKYQRIKKPKKSSKGSSKNRKQSSECEDPTVPSSVPSVPRGQLRLVPAGSSTGLVSGLPPAQLLPPKWMAACPVRCPSPAPNRIPLPSFNIYPSPAAFFRILCSFSCCPTYFSHGRAPILTSSSLHSPRGDLPLPPLQTPFLLPAKVSPFPTSRATGFGVARGGGPELDVICFVAHLAPLPLTHLPPLLRRRLCLPGSAPSQLSGTVA